MANGHCLAHHLKPLGRPEEGSRHGTRAQDDVNIVCQVFLGGEEIRQRCEDFARSVEGQLSMTGTGVLRMPEREHSIAHALKKSTRVLLNYASHVIDMTLEDLDQLFWRDILGKFANVDNVAQEHRANTCELVWLFLHSSCERETQRRGLTASAGGLAFYFM